MAAADRWKKTHQFGKPGASRGHEISSQVDISLNKFQASEFKRPRPSSVRTGRTVSVVRRPTPLIEGVDSDAPSSRTDGRPRQDLERKLLGSLGPGSCRALPVGAEELAGERWVGPGLGDLAARATPCKPTTPAPPPASTSSFATRSWPRSSAPWPSAACSPTRHYWPSGPGETADALVRCLVLAGFGANPATRNLKSGH
jgi:hypothetical protein